MVTNVAEVHMGATIAMCKFWFASLPVQLALHCHLSYSNQFTLYHAVFYENWKML